MEVCGHGDHSYHLEGARTLPVVFKMPSWRGEGRDGCPEELSPNGATSTQRGVGLQERRDMPAESGEGMKGTYPICWSSDVAHLPPLSHLPLRSYTLGYL